MYRQCFSHYFSIIIDLDKITYIHSKYRFINPDIDIITEISGILLYLYVCLQSCLLIDENFM